MKRFHDVRHITNIFFKDLVRIHCFPIDIVSDRDSKFMSHFLKTLWKKLGTDLYLGSSCHVQIHGLTEVVNGSLENFLRFLTKEYWSNMG